MEHAHALATLSVRADRSPLRRYDLAAPEVRPGGVTVFEAVLASPGVSDYPELGIRERTPPEVLADAKWLASLAGLPIIDDPDLHWRGVTLDDLPAARIGTILDARWDAVQEVAIVRIAIDTDRGLRLIRRGVLGLSGTYQPDSEAVTDDPDGATHTQRRRRGANHVLLTDTPRDIAARIRADATGGPMTDEQIAQLKADILAATKRADSEGDVLAMLLEMLMSARSDAMRYQADAEKMRAEMDAAKSEDEMRADALASAPKAADWRDVLKRADALDIEVADDATIEAVKQAIVGKHLPARADAVGDALADAYTLTCAALDAAPEPRERGAAWRNRADSTTAADASGVAALLTI